MIDRPARNQLLAAIDDYLAGSIKSFAFDDRIHAIQTNDRTVQKITRFCWTQFDDLIDHPVKFTRQQWNFFQRLRLILQSDAVIVEQKARRPSPFHIWMLGAVGLLAVIAGAFGIGYFFYSAYVACGAAFVLLQMKQPTDESPPSVIPPGELIPFATFSSMRDVYESTPDFRKHPYPPTLDLTPLRTTFTLRLMMLQWLICWPVCLLIVLLNTRTSLCNVTLADASCH